MCAVFGLIDFKANLSTRKKNKIITVLAQVCECRGTDATGIAYNYNGRLQIYKRPLPAHKMRFRVPNGVRAVIGHTRMTTQGSEKHNQNNHPFPGKAEHAQFALAHNGVLWNDQALRLEEGLTKTDIETDSYIAVQLLEKQRALTFSSLKQMAEKVQGSFVFTVLDAQNQMYFVTGNNPLTIFEQDGFYLYASTEEILRKTSRRLCLPAPKQIFKPEEGDILQIDQQGKITYERFAPQHTLPHWWRSAPFYETCPPETQGDLLNTAKAMGFAEDEVLALLDYGCTAWDIEEMLYDPALLHEAAAELLYAY